MVLNTFWLWIAATLNAATLVTHIFVGGRYIARPLLKSEMHSVAKFTNYFCWHMVTITLLGTSASFALAAQYNSAWELGVLATALSIGFCLLNLLIVVVKKQRFLFMPQWSFFLLISIAALMSIWAA